MMRLGNGRLIRFKCDLRLVVVNMKSTQDKNQTRECRVRRNGFEPIIVEIE